MHGANDNQHNNSYWQSLMEIFLLVSAIMFIYKFEFVTNDKWKVECTNQAYTYDIYIGSAISHRPSQYLAKSEHYIYNAFYVLNLMAINESSMTQTMWVSLYDTDFVGVCHT